MSLTQPVLRVGSITKSYHLGNVVLEILSRKKEHHSALTALDGIDLELRKGEILALVGESGSGKSTLAKILVGSVDASSGDLEYQGAPMPAKRGKDVTRRIQMVFQDPYSSLNPRMSVGAVLSELLLLHKIVPRREVRAESIRLLNRVGLDAEVLDAYPSQFSGGQRQRIAIARAFLKDAPILLLDEATAALDSESEEAIREALARLMHGRTVIAIAHRLATLRSFDRVVMLRAGKIIEDGPPHRLMQGQGPYRDLVTQEMSRLATHAA